MPSLLLRILLLYNFLNSVLLFLTPKKLRSFLPSFFKTQSQPRPTSSSSSKFNFPHKKMDSAELNHVFQMFDKNGDGRITKAELNDSLENMGIFIPDKELTQMIKSIDVDGDGCVDIDEFRDLYNSITNQKNGGDEEEEDEDMKEAFDVFDKNGDGFISVDELKCVLGSLGLKQGRSLEDCKTMIRKVDVDGDGLVNFKEFLQMMKGGGLGALS